MVEALQHQGNQRNDPMFNPFKTQRTPPMPRDVEDELMSLCRSAQIELRHMSPYMRRDIGLDCGCAHRR